MVKRMRIFAGPNGSGKTTIINDLQNQYSFGSYVNADDIEATLRKYRKLDLSCYQINASTQDIQDFFKQSEFSPNKLDQPDLWKHFQMEDQFLCVEISLNINSYIAADVAEFLRQQLLKAGLSFTYETVMSHNGKLDFMREARAAGYRVYLYYIATEDPEININRVSLRVAQSGHAVSPEVIRKRYTKSLENLKEAVQLTDRAYLFDNSGEKSKLVAEITNGKEVSIPEIDMPPLWFITYLYDR